jgi:SAM-dependent methyltransferase
MGAEPGVAPDGSPVEVYLRLPLRGEPELIHGAVDPGASILELGCGVGRVTRGLVALGHPVVAVDNTPEMLRHVRQVTGAEPVLADVFALDLGRRFDAVVLGSHFVDDEDAGRRRTLLEVARRHVEAGGAVLVERYDPAWARQAEPSTSRVGDVVVAFHDVVHDGDVFSAAVTYTVEGRSWTQRFRARVVDDRLLRTSAASVGLRLERWLDERRTWALLRA